MSSRAILRCQRRLTVSPAISAVPGVSSAAAAGTATSRSRKVGEAVEEQERADCWALGLLIDAVIRVLVLRVLQVDKALLKAMLRHRHARRDTAEVEISCRAAIMAVGDKKKIANKIVRGQLLAKDRKAKSKEKLRRRIARREAEKRGEQVERGEQQHDALNLLCRH